MIKLIKHRFTIINIVFFIVVLVFCNSCKKRLQDGKLDCILDNIAVDVNGMNIEVSQHNGWTDTTVLLSIIYHRKAMNIPISSDFKGVYRGNRIYFSQFNIDSLDRRNYKQIPSNIVWSKNVFKIQEDNTNISFPYNPMSVQIEYDLKTNCISSVIRGKGYMLKNFESKCGYCIY